MGLKNLVKYMHWCFLHRPTAIAGLKIPWYCWENQRFRRALDRLLSTSPPIIAIANTCDSVTNPLTKTKTGNFGFGTTLIERHSLNPVLPTD